MKRIIPHIAPTCIATILAFVSDLSAAGFLDDFSSDTSASYVYTSTYGTDTATWNVSGGTLNLPVSGGGGQTANLFYNTATLAIGDTVSVDISGPGDTYLTVSTTTFAPNVGTNDGVRLNWKPGGTFRARRYTDGSGTNTDFHSSFDVNAPGPVTLYLTRESDNTFSAAYDSGSGLTQLNTTGGTEKETFTAGDTGNGDLYIGVETFGSSVRNFDNLQVSAPDFHDDFSSDTAADYIYTSTYGTDTATWDVSNGTLNLPVSGGDSQTANLFYNTATLAIGDTVSVDISGPSDTYLTVSTTSRAPNTAGEDGVRLNWESDGTFRARRYTDGSGTNTDFHSSFDVNGPDSLTLYLTRESDNTFSAAYDSGSALTQLNTTGGTEKEIFTAGDTGNGDMFIGVETFGSGVRNFDNLRAGTLTELPTISSFSASSTLISTPGDVTFTWSATNASTVTLNGQDVIGQSPLTIAVTQTQDFTLLATHSNGSTVSQTVRVVIGESFSIAAVADPQYADVPVGWRGGGREPEEGVSRLTHAITQWNQRDLDWGVMVGDIIDFDDIAYGNPPPDTVDGVHDWANTDAMLAAWNLLNIPKYTVLGNHEFYVPAYDTDGMPKPYSVYRKFGFDQQAHYSFRHKGFRFIVLDGDNSHNNYPTGSPEYTIAKNYFDAVGSPQAGGNWWNAGIYTPQLIWLMEELDESQALDEPVVIMCHYPIHTPVAHHSMYNSDEIRAILDGYSSVVLWLNGHNHSGDYKKEGDRHHLNLKGMQNEAASWYQLDFSPAQITVFKAENTTTPERTMDILQPLPTVSAPAGFAVAEASGDASLSWSAEPAEATHVVIERRHISIPAVELPTNTQTLSWQTVTTLPSPSAGSYLDSPANPVSEYKYRIRFLGGDEGSHYSQALAPDEVTRISYEDYAASLGAGYELANADADGDGKSNVLEQFYGTDPSAAESDATREFKITTTPAGVTQLVFSCDTSALLTWDIALSKDLITWKTISENVDYRVVLTEAWTPAGTSQNLSRITIELMDTSSYEFNPSDPAYFFKLVVTQSSP